MANAGFAVWVPDVYVGLDQLCFGINSLSIYVHSSLCPDEGVSNALISCN